MSAPDDPFDLARFVRAQQHDYDRALDELRRGAKRTHWMWYVFPQLAGLGASAMSVRYAIRGRAEAEAYLAHPALGARLRECTGALLAHEGRSARAIMGAPDDLKLRSSMTLFEAVSGDPLFAQALARYFGGERDERTLQLLRLLPSPTHLRD